MDINISKKGMGVIIYYIKSEYIKLIDKDFKKRPPQSVVQLIIYLSQILIKAETRYQPIKIKVAYVT